MVQQAPARIGIKSTGKMPFIAVCPGINESTAELMIHFTAVSLLTFYLPFQTGAGRRRDPASPAGDWKPARPARCFRGMKGAQVAAAAMSLIAARDLRLANLRIPIRHLLGNFSHGARIGSEPNVSRQPGPILSSDSSPSAGGTPVSASRAAQPILSSDRSPSTAVRRFYAGLTYEAVDSLGKSHTSWSGMQVVIDVTPTRWNSLGRHGEDRTLPLVPLFR